MSKVYAIQFNGPGLDYVRQVLGQRPHDETFLLIRSIEQQRAEQDNPPPQVEVPAAPPAVKTPRARKVRPAALNGAGHAPAANQ